MSHKFYLVLPLLILAFFIRFFLLNQIPKGLHADEMSFIINTQSLMATGKDEDGQALPFHLYSFIDPKPALYSYLQMPFFRVFGPSVMAARLPAVLFGVLSIYLLYAILHERLGAKTALLTSALMVVSPWHIIVSRGTQEVIMSFAFMLLAILAFQKLHIQNFTSWKQQLPWWITLCIASFLAMDSYHSAKIFIPLLVGITLFLEMGKKITQKQLIFSGKILAIMVLVLGLTLGVAGSTARFQAVGILNNVEPQLLLEEQIREATGLSPLFLLRLFYNKAIFFGRSFLQVYFEHFTTDFLFLEGGQPLRYKVPYHGLFFLSELLLLPIGLAIFLKDEKYHKQRSFFLAWLLIAPLPAALTFIETPSMIRTFSMLVPILVFNAVALRWLWTKRRDLRVFPLTLFAIFGYLWGMGYFAHQFFIQQPIFKPWYRNTPYHEIAKVIKEKYTDYTYVVVTNDLRPLYSYFVYEGLIPFAAMQNAPRARDQASYSLDRFTFNRGMCDFPNRNTQTLYIGEIDCSLKDMILMEKIKYDDGLPVYGFWKYVPPTPLQPSKPDTNLERKY